MKLKYEEIKIEVTKFESEDIMDLSNNEVNKKIIDNEEKNFFSLL